MIHRPKIVVIIKYIFLALFVFLLFPASFYEPPGHGLDPSWSIAIHLAHKYNLVFGKDFIFTYGPLGILYSRFPISINIFVYILFDLYFLLTSFFVLKNIFKTQFGYGLVLFIFFVLITAMYSTPDLWYLFYFLYYLFSFIRTPSKIAYIIQAAILSLLCFYCKVNLGIITLSVFFLGVSYLLVRRRLGWKMYIGIVLSYILTTWLSARVLHVDLAGYIGGCLHIIDGYNDGMFLWNEETKGFLIAAILIILVIVLWVVYRLITFIRKKELIKNTDELFVYTVVGLCVFILFKSAFVRSDVGHIGLFFKGIGLLTGLLYLYSPQKFERKSIAVCCWVILASSFWTLNSIPGGYQSYPRVLKFSFFPIKAGEIKHYFAGIMQYNKALAASDKLETQNNVLKQLIGDKTVDIIPVDISKIYWNGLHYNPRPVIQSYSAYDEYLDNLNYQKYISPDAPDYVLFSLGSIDRRFPFFDESKTKLALLAHYSIAGEIDGDLLLKKKTTLRVLQAYAAADTLTGKLNEDIPIKKSNDLQYSRLSVKYNTWGKIRRLFYQPPILNITLTLGNGETKTFRAVRPILEGGVLVNKYVESNQEFQYLLQSDGRLNATIKKIRIDTDSAQNGFVSGFQLTTTYYKFNDKTAEERAADSLGIAALINTYLRYKPRLVDAGTWQTDSFPVAIDNFQKHSQLIKIEGWTFRENADNKNTTTTAVLRSSDNIVYELPTETVGRGDLSIHFKRDDLAASGFTASVYKALLPPGEYKLGLVIREKGTQKQWVNFNTYQQLFIPGDNTLDITDSVHLGPLSKRKIAYAIESVKQEDDELLVQGWAFIEKADPKATHTSLLLKGKEKIYRVNATITEREDVGAYFKVPLLIHSGFTAHIAENKLPVGIYTIGLEKEDPGTKERSVTFSDKTVTIGNPGMVIPTLVTGLPSAEDFRTGIESFKDSGEMLMIAGWAVQRPDAVPNSIVELILKGEGAAYAATTVPVSRPDVTAALKNGFNLDNSGFSARVSTKELPKGRYQVGVHVYQKGNKGTVKFTDRFIVKP